MSHTSISIVCANAKETCYNIESISRLLACLDPDDLAEEADIVGELLTAIADAAGTVAAGFTYQEPAPSAFDLTDTRTPTAGWNLVQ
ncbi:MAG: hypothetical protein E6R10_07235 [Rhodocyclaceae bacterium]|nr:MAG: hypothetical protein E6R10_07235 [Rhodocyclaceae bacterium]